MPNIMAGSLGGRFPAVSPGRLQIVSAVLNNVCNLQCKHCYLEPLQQPLRLSREKWLSFFGSLLGDLAPDVLSFAGKEVFADRGSAELLFSAIRMRNRLQRGRQEQTHIGVITNGTLLHRFRRDLNDCAPDHIDVSIDGLPAMHDEIRGPGAFAKLRPNLEWLARDFPKPVWITHTLFASTFRALPDFVAYFSSNFSLRHFSLGLYHSLPYTAADLTLSAADYKELFEQTLPQLSQLRLQHPVDVILDIGADTAPIFDAVGSDIDLQRDVPFASTVRTYANGLNFRVNVSRIPVGLWRAVRVTPEGYWLPAEDLVYAREYAARAVTRLEDHHYDARGAYLKGLEHLPAGARGQFVQ